MNWEDPSPWHVPLSSPLKAPGPPHCPPDLPGSGGEMECCFFPPSGPAVGYLFVVYPGNTRFQRNHQNFGAGRQKAAARNRWRGSTGIRLCPVTVAAPLGRTFPHQHWQHPWLLSSGMLMPQHPNITPLGSPSQDFHPWITAREDTAEPGRNFSGQQHQPNCSREFTSSKRGKLVPGMV